MKTFATIAAATVVALALAAPASAGVLAYASNTAPDPVNAPDYLILGNGATSLAFSVTVPKVVMITFTAECGFGSDKGYAAIDILVDGIPVGATAGTDDAFCTGRLPGTVSGLGMRSVTVPLPVGPGAHSVRVKAYPVGAAGATVWIDDSTTIVHD
ncbi:hypothetical protein [Oharaeibacter diazotrophicus]|uniref:Uncharacterized protein n=1 Tax=Oharaeibacter diazotrophicus TaxID=1920512 RepID=A0A4R6RJ55_9HYPH|nr:hypothetical protein [Oharaeibacter diazotrophicus]TDP86579.1 hypothetical protein EDD54_0458 [Oharaeibacter diazotrophicus]BBE71479.1 hypothetical protein OHA_1_01054 [Pleomorphomonas sp. SM30]GLS78240.1 hypothetical protein GCM10007904_35770 [Oharaeibacter diazotrophicus]